MRFYGVRIITIILRTAMRSRPDAVSSFRWRHTTPRMQRRGASPHSALWNTARTPGTSCSSRSRFAATHAHAGVSNGPPALPHRARARTEVLRLLALQRNHRIILQTHERGKKHSLQETQIRTWSPIPHTSARTHMRLVGHLHEVRVQVEALEPVL